MVNGWEVNGPLNTVGNIAWTWYLQKMAALTHPIKAHPGIDCLRKIALHMKKPLNNLVFLNGIRYTKFDRTMLDKISYIK